eukprot:SAG11_NODE_2080_length_3853_cov_12.378796_4_plen_154_part_00
MRWTVNQTRSRSLLRCPHRCILNCAQDQTFDQRPLHTTVAIGLAIYCLIILLCVGGLLSYHIGLINSNTTTNEDLKATFGAAPSPYDEGGYTQPRSAHGHHPATQLQSSMGSDAEIRIKTMQNTISICTRLHVWAPGANLKPLCLLHSFLPNV